VKVRYAPLFKDFPPLQALKPVIPEEDRRLAQASPPPALPLHCKPWLDASSHGLLLTFPYRTRLTIQGRADDVPIITMAPASSRLVYSNVASAFGRGGHFGVSSGYWLRTDPGIGIFTSPVPDGYPAKAALVSGLVQTWRYPKNLFIVFKSPAPGETITFEQDDPLCVLMPVACERVTAEEMSGEEIAEVKRERQFWQDHLEQHPDLAWTSAEGQSFTHLYKAMTARDAPRPGSAFGES
jgi:hypothetical protein